MLRMTVCALVTALLLASFAVRAQSRGCVERPNGSAVDVAGRGRAPGGRAVVMVPGVPAHGQDCIAVVPPVADVLRGPPAPGGGVLRGDDGRRDLLRGR